MLSYWLKWGLMNFLPRVALNYDPPDLSFHSSWLGFSFFKGKIVFHCIYTPHFLSIVAATIYILTENVDNVQGALFSISLPPLNFFSFFFF
jgi:hypothetical protein